MKSAALYARKSSDEKLGPRSTVEAQKDEIYSFAKANDYEIAAEFVDDAKKGWDTSRPGLLAMVAESKRKDRRFDTIIVAEWDRLYRDLPHAKLLLEELEAEGIETASARGGVIKNRNERMGRDFLLFVAEIENEIRAGHSLAGQKHWSSKGYSVCGLPPYGYKRDMVMDERGNVRIRYAPDENKAPVVRQIYEMYASGVCMVAIAERLNSEHIPAPKADQWCSHTVSRILFATAHQQKYLGCMVFNRTRHFKKNGKRPLKDKAEWVVTSDAHPAIITQDLADAVNEMRKHPARGRGGSRYRRKLPK